MKYINWEIPNSEEKAALRGLDQKTLLWMTLLTLYFFFPLRNDTGCRMTSSWDFIYLRYKSTILPASSSGSSSCTPFSRRANGLWKRTVGQERAFARHRQRDCYEQQPRHRHPSVKRNEMSQHPNEPSLWAGSEWSGDCARFWPLTGFSWTDVRRGRFPSPILPSTFLSLSL